MEITLLQDIISFGAAALRQIIKNTNGPREKGIPYHYWPRTVVYITQSRILVLALSYINHYNASSGHLLSFSLARSEFGDSLSPLCHILASSGVLTSALLQPDQIITHQRIKELWVSAREEGVSRMEEEASTMEEGVSTI